MSGVLVTRRIVRCVAHVVHIMNTLVVDAHNMQEKEGVVRDSDMAKFDSTTYFYGGFMLIVGYRLHPHDAFSPWFYYMDGGLQYRHKQISFLEYRN